MLTRFTHWRTCGLVAAIVLMCVAGCGKEEPAKPKSAAKPQAAAKTEVAAKQTAPKTETEAESAAAGLTGLVKETVASGVAELSDQLVAKLVEADKLDGKADKIIEKCAGCGLKMDGKSDHALEVSGYTMYFCSASCQQEFAKDLAKSIEEMEIPKP
jgi:YHS domain-containing protein